MIISATVVVVDAVLLVVPPAPPYAVGNRYVSIIFTHAEFGLRAMGSLIYSSSPCVGPEVVLSNNPRDTRFMDTAQSNNRSACLAP